jgi:hypothetical protein
MPGEIIGTSKLLCVIWPYKENDFLSSALQKALRSPYKVSRQIIRCRQKQLGGKRKDIGKNE